MSEFKEEIERLTNWYNVCFSEERRIQGLINNAVYNIVNEEKQKSKKELEKIQIENEIKFQNEINEIKAQEICHLLELDISIEKIIEITGYPIEFVNEVFEMRKQNKQKRK